MAKKNFLLDNDLYTADCSKILTLHNLLQKVNFVVAILEVLSVFIMMISEVIDEEGFILLPIAVIVALVTLFINKLVLNVMFGWIYDVRVMRMNQEKSSEN